MLYIEPHQVWFWVWSSSSNGRGSIQIGHSGRGCIKIYQNVLSPLLHQKVDNHTPLRTSNLWLSDTLSAMIDVSFGSLYCNNYHFAGGAFLTWPTLPHNAQHEDDISLNKMTPRFIRSRPLSRDHYQSKRALRTDILTILAAHQQLYILLIPITQAAALYYDWYLLREVNHESLINLCPVQRYVQA